MITFRNVAKRHRTGQQALVDATFEVGNGEFVFLTGRSGAGKSTVLRLVAAIERPTAGTVQVGGQEVGQLAPAAIPYLRRRIGLVLQDHHILFDRDVFENVALPLRVLGFNRQEAARRVRAALERVGLLDRERAAPVTLSGGEQQRLCIARAIVHRPSLLLVDEPTAFLDAEYARDILDLFRTFNQVGVTVLLATHDDTLLENLPARRIHLEHGRVVQ